MQVQKRRMRGAGGRVEFADGECRFLVMTGVLWITVGRVRSAARSQRKFYTGERYRDAAASLGSVIGAKGGLHKLVNLGSVGES